MSNGELIELAIKAKKNAYAKISNYCVGAALLGRSGEVYIGANVEEPIIQSLSTCAERVAFQNAFSHGEREFDKIAIVGGYGSDSELDLKIVPCGVCLQYMFDMAKDVDIILQTEDGIVERKVKDLLKVNFESYKG